MRYCIGNIPYRVDKDELVNTLIKHGYVVTDVDMVRDKLTGRFRGYAFAELDRMPEEEIIVGIRRLHIKQLER